MKHFLKWAGNKYQILERINFWSSYLDYVVFSRGKKVSTIEQFRKKKEDAMVKKSMGTGWTWFADYLCASSKWEIVTDPGRRVQVGMGVFSGSL